MDQRPSTNVYVDAFNLYYGAVKDTPYRWLNLAELCHRMLPEHRIAEIKYFTARVSARLQDPRKPLRQQIYLRALRTIPNLSIIFGHFLSHTVRMPLAGSPPEHLQWVTVMKTEEKGSDVNLATHLLHDAHRGRYQIAVIVSNDSDLIAPIDIVTRELGLRVGVLCPHARPSRDLLARATFFKRIRPGVLASSQFPVTLNDAQGIFHKPPEW